MPARFQNKTTPVTALEKNALAQGFFTPCATGSSLLNKLRAAEKNAGSGGATVSLSPADFGFDQIQDEQQTGGVVFAGRQFNLLWNFRGKFQSQE